jgi:hypothetical protein
LLANLGELTKREGPAVSEFSDAIKAVNEAVEAECHELYR